MLEPKSFEDQVRDLYHFFVNTELNNEEVTYEQIQERLIDRRYDTLVWYANNFWTWFLSKKKEKRGRYRVFVSHDLARYPEAFFVAAHLNNQGKYFYHFGGALADSRERARVRKQVREQAGVPQPELSEPPTEVGQEFPEKLQFADNETEETEDSESSQNPSSLSEVIVPVAENGSRNVALIQAPEMSILERITDMLGFSRKDREALEQLRAGQDQLRHELETLKQFLAGQLQQITPSLTEMSQMHGNVVSQGQTQERFRMEFIGKIEELTKEIHQSYTPPDFSPIHIDLAKQVGYLEQVLTSVIRQSPAPLDLASIGTEFEKSSERLRSALVTEIQQILVTEIAIVQEQVNQFAQSSSASLNGSTGLIMQMSINKASAQAHAAIATLERTYIEWLNALQLKLQTSQQNEDELRQSFLKLESEHMAHFGELHQKLQTTRQGHDEIRAYVSPGGEESQDGLVV